MALWRSGARSSLASALVTTSGAAVSRSSRRQSESARSRSGKSFRTSPSTRPSSRPGRMVRRRSICRRSGFSSSTAVARRENITRAMRGIERAEQRRHVTELLRERLCRRLRVGRRRRSGGGASRRATTDRRRAARDRQGKPTRTCVARVEPDPALVGRVEVIHRSAAREHFFAAGPLIVDERRDGAGRACRRRELRGGRPAAARCG